MSTLKFNFFYLFLLIRTTSMLVSGRYHRLVYVS